MGDLDDYSGPMVAVLVRNVLSRPPEVVSVHPTEDEAARWLGRMLLAGRGRGMDWEVVTVPAPGLVGDDPARVLDAADGQRHADLAAALGLDGPDQSWTTMCRKVRGLRQAEDERAAFVADVRDVLGRAQHDPASVQTMPPFALLDLMRSLVEAVNAPAAHRADLEAKAARLDVLVGDDPARVQLDDEGLARAVAAFHNAPGLPDVALIQHVVRAYLTEDED